MPSTEKAMTCRHGCAICHMSGSHTGECCPMWMMAPRTSRPAFLSLPIRVMVSTSEASQASGCTTQNNTNNKTNYYEPNRICRSVCGAGLQLTAASRAYPNGAMQWKRKLTITTKSLTRNLNDNTDERDCKFRYLVNSTFISCDIGINSSFMRLHLKSTQLLHL